ncbi:MAG: hypothetical protein OXF23_00055 [Candidatus Dadabacteria bacterium]|nr:hypothetical protein [Candidatus Dadabacteria bacterium]
MSSIFIDKKNRIITQRWREITEEAGRIDPSGEKWIFWLKDWGEKGIYYNVGEFKSYEEACEHVLSNPALNIFHMKWTRHVANRQDSYGFLAMQYDDSELEKLTTEHLKPIVKKILGYDLIDMRDVQEAGVIDNILRDRIRNSKFVIADLSHDNNGVYWESGFAEALEKPAIYICEKKKFDDVKTHFDTSHCTTVLWSFDKIDLFEQELTATLRRSLNV